MYFIMDIKIASTYNFANYLKFEKIWVFVVLCKEILVSLYKLATKNN